MSDRCNREQLEALVFGELSPERAEAVEQHAAGCEPCGDELAWLRAERSAMAERAEQQAELPPELWQGIEQRIGGAPAPARERRGLLATLLPWRGGSGERARWFGFGLATAAAAAAVLFVVLRSGDGAGPQPIARGADAGVSAPEPAPEHLDRLAEADRAIEEAEAAHLAAIAALEVAYAESRDQLDPEVAARYDEQFATTRATLDEARAAAGDDIGARLRLLDAYAAHQRSMRSALYRIQENQ